MLLFRLVILRLQMTSEKHVRVMCRRTFHFFPSIYKVRGRVSHPVQEPNYILTKIPLDLQISIGLHTSLRCSSRTSPLPPNIIYQDHYSLQTPRLHLPSCRSCIPHRTFLQRLCRCTSPSPAFHHTETMLNSLPLLWCIFTSNLPPSRLHTCYKVTVIDKHCFLYIERLGLA